MKNGRATVAALVTLLLCAAPVLAKNKKCGNGVIDPGEQCDGTLDAACPGKCVQCECPPVTTYNIASKAKPANCPGTKGVTVTNSKLIEQFGNKPKLNKARYTRFQVAGSKGKPDAILILIPGFEGGAGNFRILAQNLLNRMSVAPYNKQIEVWAFDRRTNQLEDTKGLDLAEKYLDPMLAINWLFGNELSIALDPRLHRRAVFYNAQDDVPFLANWTNLVFSQDIDAVVNKALKQAKNKNVFLGGHSMGTAFTARYASTDFNITRDKAGNLLCNGTPQPGYAKLRGLVLLEGQGGNTAGPSLTDDTLDRMIAKFDGGLFGAVRDNAPRCVDGTTACTIATEATDCAGQTPPLCTPPTTSYSLIQMQAGSKTISLVNPRIDAQAEPLAIQAVNDPNTGEGITSKSGAEAAVPDLLALELGVPRSTVEGGFGSFLDKDSPNAAVAPFLAMSLGEPGPTVDGLFTWKDILHGGSPPEPPVVFGPWNAQCTGAGAPYACCTGAGMGTCDLNAECTGAATPYACCTKAGTGTCDVNAECTGATTPYPCCTGAQMGTCDVNVECTGATTPYACCTGPGMGTCTVPIALSNPLPKWGEDKEVTRLDRVLWAFFAGKTNFTDWYFPNAGPSTTSVTGVCTSDTCTVGNVGAPCLVDADCSQAINLDSTQLSAPVSAGGRGRCDIENLTQAGKINIPVIGFSASQGLANLPGVYTPFGQSIATCSHDVAPSCDGTTLRVIDPGTPNATPPAYNNAFPEFGGIAGGYEVHVNIGFAHLDVCTAEDTVNAECTGAATPYPCCTDIGTGTCADNNVVKPLSDFIARNIQ
ncbi:MAG: alpha/beta fold hydrolase [Candidatus Binatia bacterium]|jgi:pimeloyl-ACP methyl ester carboxylesterase